MRLWILLFTLIFISQASATSFEERQRQTLADLNEHFSSLLDPAIPFSWVHTKALQQEKSLSDFLNDRAKTEWRRVRPKNNLTFKADIPSRAYPTLYYLLLHEIGHLVWHKYAVEKSYPDLFQKNPFTQIYQMNFSPEEDFAETFTLRALAYKPGNYFELRTEFQTLDLLQETKSPVHFQKMKFIDDLLLEIVSTQGQ